MTTAEVERWNGRVVDGMPHNEYVRDPIPGRSLSSTGARLLIPPNCPRKFAYHRTHPTMPKLAYDLGTAAHKEVLGTGPELVVVDAPTWHTNDAKDRKKAAYAAGQTPLLEHQYDEVQEMALAVREHPLASRLLAPGSGIPEQSLSWRDPVSGVMCRARFDWLSYLTTTDGKLIVVDYKTTTSADPDKLVSAIRRYRYHMQAAWYIDAVIGCRRAADAVFLFVFQETERPYVITVMELHDITGLWVGRELNDHARKVYARCEELGVWPGHSGALKLFKKGPDINYDDDVLTADLPDWEIREMESITGQGS
jgi:hypothetical protein